MQLPHISGLAVLAWAIACVWGVTIVVVVNACRKRSPLRPMTDGSQPEILPKLSVIVPARNESASIETCIRSLMRQDYPDLEVVAVNDRSTDDTGEILDRLALEFADRLRVLHVSTLPSGWFGKPHALDLGMKSVNGSLVCFTDADCEFLAPSALRTTVVELLRSDVDFFSMAAKYTMSSLRECVAVPCCAEAIFAWLRPERVSDPGWPDAFANGAFILVRKDAFETTGGWGSVRSKISEDLELARAAKRSGLRLKVEQGEGFYQTGSYGSLQESWNGWSRIFKGSLTPVQLMITLVRMVFLFVVPLVAVLYGAATAARGGSLEWLTYGAGLAFTISFVFRCVLDVVVFRLVGAPIFTAILAPLGRLYVMLAVSRALLSHAGLVRTHWRGTTFVSGRMIIPEQAKA